MAITRHLNRTATHRKALLRNLVTALIEHESITTTHAKAKEAQASAEWLITLAKNKSPDEKQARIRAEDMVFKPNSTIPKLFEDIAPRYEGRTGGYTRVLRLENRIGDNAPQSVLELVGGKRDLRFSMTARIVARLERQGLPIDKVTAANVRSILQYRTEEEFRQEVEFMKETFYKTEKSIQNLPVDKPKKKRAPIQLVENPLNEKAA
uniref:ARAD1C42922p n=1 Tax=Blastobotrys adeninivorans TaxID=409370 RepID=A0A060T3U6_BLAAD